MGTSHRVQVTVAGLIGRIGHEVLGEAADGVPSVLGHDAVARDGHPSEGGCGRHGDGADELGTIGDRGREVECRTAAGGELLGGCGEQECELGVVSVQGGCSDGDRGLSQGCLPGFVRVLVGASTLSYGEDAEDDSDGERGGDGASGGAEDAVGAGLAAYLPRQHCRLGIGVGGARVEKDPLDRRELDVRPFGPRHSAREPDPAVELALGPSQVVPGPRRGGQVVEDPAPVDILVEPTTQAGPAVDERLVRHGDGSVIDGHEPGADEEVQDGPVRLVQVVLRHPGSAGFGVVAHDDQTKHQRPQHGLLRFRERRVDLLGGVGQRTAHAATRPIPRHGQGAAFATSPRLGQRMGEQRERYRGFFEVAEKQFDEPWFDQQPALRGRLLDRGREPLGAESSEDEEALAP